MPPGRRRTMPMATTRSCRGLKVRCWFRANTIAGAGSLGHTVSTDGRLSLRKQIVDSARLGVRPACGEKRVSDWVALDDRIRFQLSPECTSLCSDGNHAPAAGWLDLETLAAGLIRPATVSVRPPRARPRSGSHRAAVSRYVRFDHGHPARAQTGRGVVHGPGRPRNQTRSIFPTRVRRPPPRGSGQRELRRAGRVRPDADCVSLQNSISERSHSLTRPLPRSTTGRGMSSYRRW